MMKEVMRVFAEEQEVLTKSGEGASFLGGRREARVIVLGGRGKGERTWKGVAIGGDIGFITKGMITFLLFVRANEVDHGNFIWVIELC